MPSYSSASEEDEVQASVVEEEQARVSAIVEEMKMLRSQKMTIRFKSLEVARKGEMF